MKIYIQKISKNKEMKYYTIMNCYNPEQYPRGLRMIPEYTEEFSTSGQYSPSWTKIILLSGLLITIIIK